MPKKRWNIFASVLEDILLRHNSKITLLDDKVGIHPQQVRRLRLSLHSPPTCTVLNASELDAVIDQFHLDDAEQCRLYAAVIAAGVQDKLMKRMNNDEDNVLIAIKQIFPLLVHVLRKHKNDPGGLANFRGDE